jgi:hypothetical protein
MGSRHPRSLSGPTSPSSPSAQDASNNSLGFTRPRQAGQPENVFIQPGIPPQFSNTPTTTSQTGPNLDATRHRYRSILPQQSQSTPIQPPNLPDRSTRAGRKLYNTLLAHRSQSTSSSVTTPDISKYAGMSADEISKRIRQLDLEKAEREQAFIDQARIEREANEKAKREKKSAAVTGINNPMFGRTGEDSHMFGKIGNEHPKYGKTLSKSAKDKISENNAMLGRTGDNHPTSNAYLRNQLPEGLREMAEQKGWSREKLKLQVNAYKYEASQTTTDLTSSTSSVQNPPEEPLVIPRQPTQESSTDQSPPKQDKSDDPDKPDLDF